LPAPGPRIADRSWSSQRVTVGRRAGSGADLQRRSGQNWSEECPLLLPGISCLKTRQNYQNMICF